MKKKPDNKKEENNSPKALTRIHETYTLSNTPEEINEADAVIIRHFMHTLAEVALAIAARKIEEKEEAR